MSHDVRRVRVHGRIRRLRPRATSSTPTSRPDNSAQRHGFRPPSRTRRPAAVALALLCFGGPLTSTASASRADRDRLPDSWERRFGLSTKTDSAGGDVDHDQLSNLREYRLRLNPRRADTDRDGLKDGAEVKRYKTDPRKADTDGDGVVDGVEVKRKSNPRARSSVPDQRTASSPLLPLQPVPTPPARVTAATAAAPAPPTAIPPATPPPTPPPTATPTVPPTPTGPFPI